MRPMLAIMVGVTASLAAACTHGGEPMTGDVTLTIGTAQPKLKVGAVVASTRTHGDMVVQMGDTDVDCGSTLDQYVVTNTTGSFVFFSVASAAGTYDATEISVEQSSQDQGIDSSQSTAGITQGFGVVTIDRVDADRVTGSAQMMTSNDRAGTISVSGSFDIKKCF